MRGAYIILFLPSYYYSRICVLDDEANSMKYSVDEEEIETQTEALRKKLLREMNSRNGPNTKGLKIHQVHELAEAKIKQDDKFRSALGISRHYEEGSHWKKDEERRMAKLEKESKEVEQR